MIEKHELVYQTLLRLNTKLRPKEYHFQETWFREYGTISWDAGKGTGKSTWIARTLTQDDIVVCPTCEGRKVITDLVPKLSHHVYAVEDLGRLEAHAPRKRYSRIILDDAMWVDQHVVYKMTLLHTHSKTLYVCVG